MLIDWLVAFIWLLHRSTVESYNRPTLRVNASWNLNATTLADVGLVGLEPVGTYVSANNSVYVADRQHGAILVWHPGSLHPNRTISGNLIKPWSLFVTLNGDIYADNGDTNGRIDKWTLNATQPEVVTSVNSTCTGLFVSDVDNTLYCSSANEHRVFTVALNDQIRVPITLAGTGCPGPTSSMLDHPHGIFVDTAGYLYVADTHNNRIQRVTLDRSNTATVAGFAAAVSYILHRPTSVVLDADGELFIVESANHRIIRSISNGFKCIIGCSGTSGSRPNQLDHPQTMSFDGFGNIYVTDMSNHRVQKFNLEETAPECFSTGFINGGFESGTSAGWIIGGGSRGSLLSSQIRPENFLPGGSSFNANIILSSSSVVTSGDDSLVKSLMRKTVHQGTYAFRIGNTPGQGRVSLLSQTIHNYSYPDIYFAWLAVFHVGHAVGEGSPTVIIELRDMFDGKLLDPRPRASHGYQSTTTVDSRFRLNPSYVYTPAWVIEHWAIGSDRRGHSFRLSVLTMDCAAGGHAGYAYVDSFGSVRPQV